MFLDRNILCEFIVVVIDTINIVLSSCTFCVVTNVAFQSWGCFLSSNARPLTEMTRISAKEF